MNAEISKYASVCAHTDLCVWRHRPINKIATRAERTLVHLPGNLP